MNTKTPQLLRLVTTAVILGIVGLFLIKKFFSFIFPIAAILLFFIHKDLIKSIYGKIVELFRKNTALGALALLACVLGLTPFVGFLALKTIWDIRKNWSEEKQIQA